MPSIRHLAPMIEPLDLSFLFRPLASPIAILFNVVVLSCLATTYKIGVEEDLISSFPGVPSLRASMLLTQAHLCRPGAASRLRGENDVGKAVCG